MDRRLRNIAHQHNRSGKDVVGDTPDRSRIPVSAKWDSSRAAKAGSACSADSRSNKTADRNRTYRLFVSHLHFWPRRAARIGRPALQSWDVGPMTYYFFSHVTRYNYTNTFAPALDSWVARADSSTPTKKLAEISLSNFLELSQ